MEDSTQLSTQTPTEQVFAAVKREPQPGLPPSIPGMPPVAVPDSVIDVIVADPATAPAGGAAASATSATANFVQRGRESHLFIVSNGVFRATTPAADIAPSGGEEHTDCELY